MHTSPDASVTPRKPSLFDSIEGGFLVIAFLLSMLIPLIDALGRPFGGFSVPGSASIGRSSRCGSRSWAASSPRASGST
jgi:hypothetical protein